MRVERDDVDVGKVGTGDSGAAERVFENRFLLHQVGLGDEQILLAE